MKKSIIRLALSSLEVQLLEERQNYKRQQLNDEVEQINIILEETRKYQKEVENSTNITIQ
tara:strand:+ start:337 stop:516 length:180 start_codon:yes stop_codon:yes gene_type:complete